MSLEGCSANSFRLTRMSCTADWSFLNYLLFLLYCCANLILILILIKLGTVSEEEKENRRGVSMDRTVEIESLIKFLAEERGVESE